MSVENLTGAAAPDAGGTGAAPGGEGAAAPDMDSTIRDAYRKLTTEDAGDGAGTGGEDEDAAAAAAIQRARDAHGRFAKGEVPDDQQAQQKEQVETGEQQQPQSDLKLPKSWRQEVAAEWEKTPEAVRQEVHRREQDMMRGLGEYRDFAHIGKAVDKVIQPYAEVIRSAGLNAPQAIGNLLETAKALRLGTPEQKVSTLLQVINEYGIPFDAISQAHSQAGTRQTDPEVVQLRQRLQQLEGSITQQAQAGEQAALAETERQVQGFLEDPKKPHAKAVVREMQGLLAQGLASTLDEAYDKACQLNPEVRARLQAQQAEAERKRAAEEAAAARRASSTNVARRGTHPAPAPKGTMEDTIRSSYRKLTGS